MLAFSYIYQNHYFYDYISNDYIFTFIIQSKKIHDENDGIPLVKSAPDRCIVSKN